MRINSIQSFNIKKTNNQKNKYTPKKQMQFSGYAISRANIINKWMSDVPVLKFYNHTVHLAFKCFNESPNDYIEKCTENAPKEWGGVLGYYQIIDLMELKNIFSEKGGWVAKFDMRDDTENLRYSSPVDKHPEKCKSHVGYPAEGEYDPDDHGTPKDY